MISYSAKSARALAFLKRSRNDIDIFVEDAKRAQVWLSIIRLCLPKGVELTSVNPLGDRDRVVQACELDQSSRRPRLYIIDGDMDFLLGRGVRKLKFLYRVPATNLEALVLLSGGASSILGSMLPGHQISQIATDLHSYLELKWGPSLRRLFALYAEHFRLGGTKQTCSYHVSQLAVTASNPWKPDRRKFAAKARDIAKECKRARPASKRRLKLAAARSRNLPLEKVASGKTYLWPLYQNYFKQVTGISITPEALMLLVLSHGSCPAPGLRRKLRTIVNSASG